MFVLLAAATGARVITTDLIGACRLLLLELKLTMGNKLLETTVFMLEVEVFTVLGGCLFLLGSKQLSSSADCCFNIS